jgi:hypothetical protein
MSDDHFIAGLQRMGTLIAQQSNSWHEAVCAQLLPENSLQSLHSDVKYLRILPLSDGSWASADVMGEFFFNSDLTNIPRDLDLQLLSADITPSSARYRLFSKLGAKEADMKAIARRILKLHRGGSPPQSLESLISHATFIFAHHPKLASALAEFRVIDERGVICKANEVYVDILHPQQSIRMRGVLPSPARFLNPAYLQRHCRGGKNGSATRLV